eukprot:COSAG01_NODE_28315_length_664_cov_0.649558_1_plen_109_part_01
MASTKLIWGVAACIYVGQHSASAVDISTDVIVTPFDCFYYPPPQLARDGYRILNAAWTPLYIAGAASVAPCNLFFGWELPMRRLFLSRNIEGATVAGRRLRAVSRADLF